VQFLIVMVLMLAVMYVLMIRPQRQRQAQQQQMIESASVGDDVLTTGGIYGTISEAEGDDIVVEIADGVTVHMTRRGIAAVLPPEDEAEEDLEELDEPGVTDEEEPVSAAAGEVPAGDERR
jgi:preprotein translocase subunit YajC